MLDLILQDAKRPTFGEARRLQIGSNDEALQDADYNIVIAPRKKE